MQTIYMHGLGQNASSWKDVITSRKEEAQASCPDVYKRQTVDISISRCRCTMLTIGRIVLFSITVNFL